MFRTFSSIATFLFFIVACTCILPSCKKNCENISCKNGGTCADGTCSCPQGWEGELCENIAPSNYNKNFNAADSYTTGSSTSVITYTSSVSSGSNNTVLFTNFSAGNYPDVAYATLNGNSLTFPAQRASQYPGDTATLTGTGTIGFGTMQLNYTIEYTYTFPTNNTVVIDYTGYWN